MQGGRLPRCGGVRREDDFLHAGVRGGHPLEQLRELEILRVDPVDRREGSAEDVVDAVVLVGALHRDHVARLLDDADQALVPARVLADPTALLVGEVEAAIAQADPLLDLADRLGESRGVLRGRSQDVEGEPLGRALNRRPGSFESSVTSRWTGGA